MEDCIFCKIARGEIPATFVYENEHVVAFDDISPQAPVHTLIVPKTHIANMSDPAEPIVMGEIFTAVPRVAEIKGVADSGYRIIVNSGPDANQTVGHLHVHVLGGRPMAHGMVQFAE
ncbi:MAG TPA: histidine triad nucleotide-binding protein [Coriobacteriia bacterium]|nr:histidine triad nucleotide-binding protein [Coriobacteriia bacterium]